MTQEISEGLVANFRFHLANLSTLHPHNVILLIASNSAMRHFCLFGIAILLLAVPRARLLAENRPATQSSHVDSDHDGLSDSLEQALLLQFAPRFMISRTDCSNVPAEFVPGLSSPEVESENNTIYGQVFPAKGFSPSKPLVEIHYYHLWKRDCGAHGHPLDAEHVSVLVRASNSDLASAKWEAVYWFAAAHQDTVCDVSQIARASTLKAVEHGATIWVSAGKHASFLNQELCHHGCGNDICEDMRPMSIGRIINLGELHEPMNGSFWVTSSRWPLAVKMSDTDFPPAPIARLNELPSTDIAWFNSGRHPAQGIIAVSSSTADALGSSGGNTVDAISVAGESTGSAISVAGDSTGNAVQRSYDDTIHALGRSAKHVGKFLHLKQSSP